MINKEGLDIIKKFEGLRLKPYYCPAGLLTIGYGHVITKEEKEKYKDGIDIETAETILKNDLKRFEIGVLKIINNKVLTENIFSSLVSFSFNVGLGSLKISTLRQKLNRGEIIEASFEFMKWNKVAGKELKGLTLRRMCERNLFLKGISNDQYL